MLWGFSSRCWLITLGFVALLIANVAHRAEARPKYKGAFEKLYPEVGKKGGRDGKVTCNVCHFGDDKKKRNHYGEALAKELKKPNEPDAKTIEEALKAIEDGECRSGNWKKRLDHGVTPCVCGSRDLDPSSYIAHQLARDDHDDE